MKRILLTLPLLIYGLVTFAQKPGATESLDKQDRVFQLGEIIVLDRSEDSLQRLSAHRMEKFNRTEISNALNLLSGVTLANVGPRNESVVYIRGFDLRQIPVFMDGIPVYVPYDGYVDMGRFTTFDLAEISVAKGFASILYGANTMGGAINLISRRPQDRLEVEGRAGMYSGNGYRWNINAGSRLDKFYVQLGLSQIKQDYFPVSRDYSAREQEVDHQRDNSYRNDFKANVKVGFTPNDTDEYVIGYINQQGEKGNPPYVGNDPAVMRRYWQWPNWDKESLYFITNTALGNSTQVKTRWYYDAFDNSLFSYDDSTYTTMNRPYAFQSFYDDFTVGGNIELESRLSDKNTLKFGTQFKRDVHRENNFDEPQGTYIDHTLSIGIESPYMVSKSLTVVPGISYNSRKSLEANDYNSDSDTFLHFPENTNDAINAQLGAFWNINPSHTLQGSLSRKTRFATIKDRYSFRLGSAIPNPDLTAEYAINYDLTYTGRLLENLVLSTSIFRSDIKDIIQRIDNVEPGLFQLQNAGNALFYGLEANLNYNFAENSTLGGNYSFIRRKNLTDPTILFTDVPQHKLLLFFDHSFGNKLNLLVSAEHNSERYSTSYGTVADSFTLANTRLSYSINRFLGIEAGVNNLLDKDYALVEGFPEPGRNYFVTIVFQNFQK